MCGWVGCGWVGVYVLVCVCDGMCVYCVRMSVGMRVFVFVCVSVKYVCIYVEVHMYYVRMCVFVCVFTFVLVPKHMPVRI